jgi:hypothetical protein
VAQGFVDIAQLASSDHANPDKRSSAIEVAHKNHVKLKGNLKYVVLPQQYLEDGSSTNTALLSALHELNVNLKLDTYEWQPNETPNYFLDEISRLVRIYLRSTDQL